MLPNTACHQQDESNIIQSCVTPTTILLGDEKPNLRRASIQLTAWESPGVQQGCTQLWAAGRRREKAAQSSLGMRKGHSPTALAPLGAGFCHRPQGPAPSPGSAGARWRHILAAPKAKAAEQAGEINSAGKTSSADAAEQRMRAQSVCVCVCAHAHACATSTYMCRRKCLRACLCVLRSRASGLREAGWVLEICPRPLIVLL